MTREVLAITFPRRADNVYGPGYHVEDWCCDMDEHREEGATVSPVPCCIRPEAGTMRVMCTTCLQHWFRVQEEADPRRDDDICAECQPIPRRGSRGATRAEADWQGRCVRHLTSRRCYMRHPFASVRDFHIEESSFMARRAASITAIAAIRAADPAPAQPAPLPGSEPGQCPICQNVLASPQQLAMHLRGPTHCDWVPRQQIQLDGSNCTQCTGCGHVYTEMELPAHTNACLARQLPPQPPPQPPPPPHMSPPPSPFHRCPFPTRVTGGTGTCQVSFGDAASLAHHINASHRGEPALDSVEGSGCELCRHCVRAFATSDTGARGQHEAHCAVNPHDRALPPS
jgi:hypothetical protein